MEDDSLYIHRDLSWLGFNYRVLQEAKDINVPLLERLKFLAIYSSNLDEYFRVRIANLRTLLRVNKKTKKELTYDPRAVLKKVLRIVNKQQVEYSDILLNQILPELEKYNIHLLKSEDLNLEQQEFVSDFFHDNLLPYVQPVLLIKNKIRPFLNNAALYLVVHLKDRSRRKSNRYAIVKIPSDHINRFIELPSQPGHHNLMILDDIVRFSIPWLFPGYSVVNSHSIKLTRDAELYIEDEFSGNLIAKIKTSLGKRNVGPASRFVYDRDMANATLNAMIETLGLDKDDLLREGRYHNNFDFFKFPDYGFTHLKNLEIPPLSVPELEESEFFFEEIKKKDHLINIPYQSYESVIRFFEEAAHDPNVTHIKIVQYRVAKKSRIMNALIEAVKRGKSVHAFVEVKARFDEEANLKWGEVLEKAGVNVQYSFPGLKVHAKIALIRRIEEDGPHIYTYLSTGNFHEDTAKVYSDMGLFTARKEIVHEVSRVFSFLETVKIPNQDFKYLLVGQFNIREELEKMIRFEIDQALAGKQARIFLKMNSLEDQDMIDLLYEASQAGVKIKLIIRGICCLKPGVKGLSSNIEAISIVDRFLEHSRVFIFHNGGDRKMYLSSADWMVRNLSHRIEVIFPILDPEIKKTILELMEIQWNDNVKARLLKPSKYNAYRKIKDDLAVRSQMETYFYFKRKRELVIQNLELAKTPTPI